MTWYNGGMIRVFFTLWLVAAPLAAAPLSDLQGDGEARDAVRYLAAQGIIEGYPDGLFKGDRALSRYELAGMIERAEALLEGWLQQPAGRKQLQDLEGSLEGFVDELDALGTRLQNAEDDSRGLDERSDNTARPGL